MAISKVRSRSQAPAASILSCSSACSASSLSKSASGSPMAAHTSLKRSTSALASPTPSETLPSTSLVGSSCGSWARKPTVNPGVSRASPVKPSSWPGHDLEQGGLARAVAADDADLGAGVEGEVDPLQDLAVGRIEATQVAHGEDVLGCHTGQCASPAAGTVHRSSRGSGRGIATGVAGNVPGGVDGVPDGVGLASLGRWAAPAVPKPSRAPVCALGTRPVPAASSVDVPG